MVEVVSVVCRVNLGKLWLHTKCGVQNQKQISPMYSYIV
jgi:hypothetical protein